MSTALAATTHDTEDLEALFDQIAAGQRAQAQPAGAAPPAAEAQGAEPAKTKPARGPGKPRARKAARPASAAHPDGSAELFDRVGQITRTLHESLRKLGYDRMLESAAAEIPDVRDRLSYVASLTEGAAERVLAATERAMPIQHKLGQRAERLAQDWRKVFEGQVPVEGFRELAQHTVEFLDGVPQQTRETHQQLHEIMMAQDFQDLTGQVIKRITELVHGFENELIKLLLECSPATRRPATGDGLLNGPVIKAEGRDDVVASQAQVDELLESLGF